MATKKTAAGERTAVSNVKKTIKKGASKAVPKKSTSSKASTSKKSAVKRTAEEGTTAKRRAKVLKFEGARALQATTKAGSGKGALLIVESPTKAASLSKMLGPGVKVIASVGHVIDLPKSRMGVDPAKDFEPEYLVMATKQKVADKIVEAAEKAGTVLIGSDPDREGEAIAWHLAHLLGLDPKSKCRVRMRQITKGTALEAVANPDSIDLDLVDAQQARRVLDRLVGYTLSPLLWKKVKFGLSAGRVQSAALAILCDREKEIKEFVPLHYWTVTLKARGTGSAVYHLTLEKADGKNLVRDGRTMAIESEAQAREYAARLMAGPSTVTAYTSRQTSRKAPPPFKTSTLQQEASRRLRFTPKRTMSVAQKLFEGVDLPDRGPTGLITYMRTDSLRLAPVALSALRAQIKNTFGAEYLPEAPRQYAAAKNAQDAHEAIRPTDPSITPYSLTDVLTAEQYKLYDLIWRRTLASQMTEAVVNNVTLTAERDGLVTKSSGSSLVFDGWSRIWPLDLKEGLLEPVAEGEQLRPLECPVEAKETRPPSRYTEAQLIKVMEDLGIGRPSTYAATVSTIEERLYVVLNEDRRLQPTPLGQTVDAFLAQYFGANSPSPILDTGFTAQMENELDAVEEGTQPWKELLAQFWTPFIRAVEQAAEGEPMRPPKDFTGENCPLCGQPLVRRLSRYGSFVGCSNYPACEYIKPSTIGVICPKCGAAEGGQLVERRGKRKKFYGCSRYPECDYITFNKPVGRNCPHCGTGLEYRGTHDDEIVCPGCGYSEKPDSERGSDE